MRNNSPPVYPAPPAIPAFIFMFLSCQVFGYRVVKS